MRAVAQKLRDSRLTAAAGTMEVAGDRIDTPLFSGGLEATEVWVGKEVVFIVDDHPWVALSAPVFPGDGLMFWFKWNRLSGSYCFLIWARRS